MPEDSRPEELLRDVGRRWYDRVPNMAQAVHLTETLPPGIQLIIVRNLNDYIDHYRRLKRGEKSSLSVGVPKVLSLFNTGSKSRWYDPNPQMRRAFTMMATVPEEMLHMFASRVLDIADYVETKKQHSMRMSPDELVQEVHSILKNAYVTLTEESSSIKLVGEPGSSTSQLRYPAQQPPDTRVSGSFPQDDWQSEAGKVILVPNRRAGRGHRR